jgi:hypothetical protein
MVGVSGQISLRHHRPARNADDDRPFDADRVGESGDIVAPLIECPAGGITPTAAAAGAMIEVDDLRDVGEPVEGWADALVIAARTARKADQQRLLLQRGAINFELWVEDVEDKRTPLTVTNMGTPP